ncbi:hypothetical protein B0H19DRAFT_898910, partial [Mycena capillaripes]
TQRDVERASLLIYRTRTRAVLSPLRRMPPEILGCIFLVTLPKTVDAAWSHTRTGSPWIFTRVSSRWREVAISTPSLWSRVVIDYHK